jgi:ectoine hydroxylase-related dioxygenase (phytanoyl-CoA dioxygenase family)
MEWILARHEVFHAEMEPGDALFFHCNTLHRSDANRSPHRRWTLLLCYNAARNDALRREDDRSYVPLDKVDDGAIRRAGLRFAAGANDEHFTSRPYVPDVAATARQPGR